MPLLIIILVIAAAVVIYKFYNSSVKKQLAEIIERREQYVASLEPFTRIVVNNGVHLFFMNDECEFFGIDETGKKYSYEGLKSVCRFDNAIMLCHKDCLDLFFIGKDASHEDTTTALDPVSLNAIFNEIMPILRNNVSYGLEEYGICPTHECEIDGEIFGCDIHSKQFYQVSGAGLQVYDFADFLRIEVKEVLNTKEFNWKYIVEVYTWHEDSRWNKYPEIRIYIKSENAEYKNLVALFKIIKSRQ